MSESDSPTLTPTEVADALIPRLLDGEVMLRSDIEAEFHITETSASQAVRYARDVLLDEYNVVLPIANYQGDYLLAITTAAVDAFYGEMPQLRALRTRERNMLRRLHGVMALVKTRPRMAKHCIRQMEVCLAATEEAVEGVVAFMQDEIGAE